MRKLILILFLLPVFLSAQDIGGDYYVAPYPTGNDTTGDGSYGSPWHTFQKAFDESLPGDTTYFRGGVYYSTRPNIIDPNNSNGYGVHGTSGTLENPICYFNYPGETPILDCINHEEYFNSLAQVNKYNKAIDIRYAQHMKFKGITIRHVLQHEYIQDSINYPVTEGAINSRGTSNMTFENITIHDCGVKAFYVSSGFNNPWDSIYAADYYDTPGVISHSDYDTTRFINCDVYNLMDSLTYETDGSWNGGNHADGFKIENYQGSFYYFEGCRAWNYTDDGWDCNHPGYKTWVNCWAMSGANTYNLPAMEGNGFKNTAIRDMEGTTYDQLQVDELANPNDTVLIKFIGCVTVFCNWIGFYNDLYATGTIFRCNNAAFYNNTAYACRGNFDNSVDIQKDPTFIPTIYRNNIAFGSTVNECDRPQEIYVGNGVSYRLSNNTWQYQAETGSCDNWVYSDTVTVTSDDFLNGLDSATIVAQFTAPRQADGSLPSPHPFTLSPTSDLIDAGTQPKTYDGLYEINGDPWVFDYEGAAPDIGAYEYGSSTPTPSAARKRPAGTATKVYGGGDVIYEF